jgi:hypothetical protein
LVVFLSQFCDAIQHYQTPFCFVRRGEKTGNDEKGDGGENKPNQEGEGKESDVAGTATKCEDGRGINPQYQQQHSTSPHHQYSSGSTTRILDSL